MSSKNRTSKNGLPTVKFVSEKLEEITNYSSSYHLFDLFEDAFFIELQKDLTEYMKRKAGCPNTEKLTKFTITQIGTYCLQLVDGD